LFTKGIDISSINTVINLFPAGAKFLPTLKSHSLSIVYWNKPGKVALEKLVRLNNILSLLNFVEYNNTELVLAVPEPPTKMQAFKHIIFLG